MLKFLFYFLGGRQRSSRRYSRATSFSAQPTQRAVKNKARGEMPVREGLLSLPTASVHWVVDGDTVIVTQGRNETTIRLDSIDCPEDGQYWGDNAKYGLMKLIVNREVRLEMHGTDPYGRTLATIYVWHEQKNEWINVNERMVMLGHAWVMRMYYDHLPPGRQDKLNRLERWSKSRKVGLWHEENPTPPWEWRKD